MVAMETIGNSLTFGGRYIDKGKYMIQIQQTQSIFNSVIAMLIFFFFSFFVLTTISIKNVKIAVIFSGTKNHTPAIDLYLNNLIQYIVYKNNRGPPQVCL